MNDRWRTLVLSILGAAVPLSIATGSGSSIPMVIGALAVLFVVVGRVAPSAAGRRTVERTWSPAGPFVFVPASVTPARHETAVVRSLARFEARQLFPGSAAFGIGLGFCVVIVVFLGLLSAGDFNGQLPEAISIMSWLVHPLAGMTIVAVHRARTRERRDETAELFESCPATPATRDRGHLRSAWVPALAATLTVVVTMGAAAARSDVLWGPVGLQEAAHTIGAPLLAVGATALGVLLARVAPWQAAPVAAVIAIGFVSLRLQDVRSGDADGYLQLSTFFTDEGVDIRFSAVRWLEHYGWIAGLVCVTWLLARVVGSPRSRGLVAAVGLAAAATATVGWAATRPIDQADAEAIASLISEPELHQTCTEVTGGSHALPVCVYGGDGDLVADAARHISPVLAAVPEGAVIDEIMFRQGSDVAVGDLDDGVQRLLAGHQLDPAVVPVRLEKGLGAHHAQRLWAALAAVGAAADARMAAPVHLGGQARGVVAIWLATRDLPVDRAIEHLASVDRDDSDNHDYEPSRPWPSPCVAGPTAVTWALSDLDAARQLIRADADSVLAVVHTRWDDWVDPAGTTDELLSELGLAPLDEPSGRTPVVYEC